MSHEKLTEDILLWLGFLKKNNGIGWRSYSKDELEIVVVPTNKGNIPAFKYGGDKYRYLHTVGELEVLYNFLTKKIL